MSWFLLVAGRAWKSPIPAASDITIVAAAISPTGTSVPMEIESPRFVQHLETKYSSCISKFWWVYGKIDPMGLRIFWNKKWGYTWGEYYFAMSYYTPDHFSWSMLLSSSNSNRIGKKVLTENLPVKRKERLWQYLQFRWIRDGNGRKFGCSMRKLCSIMQKGSHRLKQEYRVIHGWVLNQRVIHQILLYFQVHKQLIREKAYDQNDV